MLVITQCNQGGVKDLYEAGVALSKIGALFGGDLTLSAAVTKLSYLMGKGYSGEELRYMLKRPI